MYIPAGLSAVDWSGGEREKMVWSGRATVPPHHYDGPPTTHFLASGHSRASRQGQITVYYCFGGSWLTTTLRRTLSQVTQPSSGTLDIY